MILFTITDIFSYFSTDFTLLKSQFNTIYLGGEARIHVTALYVMVDTPQPALFDTVA